ncbi:MAG TPA: hypothetical protein VM491_13715, partial [Burkholderiaceae bacterium]|nr:hypothetical protein [Burkholderiaceae bacterium]
MRAPRGDRRRHADVRLQHAVVRLHVLGPPLRQQTPLVEHDDPVGHPHHEVHVVLDQQERLAFVAKPRKHLADLVAQRRVHAGQRFIEHDQLRRANQRAAQRDQLLLPVRQFAGRQIEHFGQAHAPRHLGGALARLVFESTQRRRSQQVAEAVRVLVRMQRRRQVLRDAQRAVHADRLER